MNMKKIEKNLIGYRHRIDALQAELRENSRKLSDEEASVYHKKIEYLNQIIREIRRRLDMERILKAELIKTSSEIPDLSVCSPKEQLICARFTKRKLDLVRGAATECMRILDWANAPAPTNFVSTLRMLTRVYKIKRKIKILNKELLTMRSHAMNFERYTSSSSASPLTTKIQALMLLFKEYDQQIARILNLKARVRSENHKNLEMRDWLSKVDVRRRSNTINHPSPSQADTERALTEAQTNFIGGAKIARERLGLAEQLVGTLNGSRP
jgi:hypothetical protein